MLEKLIIQKTLRVPASTGEAGDGTPVARQLDAALLDVGFSASRALLEHVGGLAPPDELLHVLGRDTQLLAHRDRELAQLLIEQPHRRGGGCRLRIR